MFVNKDRSIGVAIFLCPGRGRPAMCSGAGGPGAWTDYFINPFLNDPNGVPNAPDVKRTLDSITDSTTRTIFVGEGQIIPSDYHSLDVKPGFTDVIFNGGSPSLCRSNKSPIFGPDTSASPGIAGNWGGPSPKWALMCMGDANVRAMPYTMRAGNIANGVSPHDDSFAAYLTPSWQRRQQNVGLRLIAW